MSERGFSYKQAAKRIGISERKLKQYVIDGVIEPCRFGRRVIFRHRHIVKLLAMHDTSRQQEPQQVSERVN